MRIKLSAALDDRGWHSTRCDTAEAISRYLVKVEGDNGQWGAGLELCRGDLKTATAGMSPWQLLSEAVAGDEAAAELWGEYEMATLGKVEIVASRALTKELGRSELTDTTDDELAAREPGDVEVFSHEFSASEWNWLVKTGHVSEVLDALQEAARNVSGWVKRPPPLARSA